MANDLDGICREILLEETRSCLARFTFDQGEDEKRSRKKKG